MPTNKISYCGNIGRKCPNKTVDGYCTTGGIVTEYDVSSPCEHVVDVADEKNQFLIKKQKRVIIHSQFPQCLGYYLLPRKQDACIYNKSGINLVNISCHNLFFLT